MFQTALLAVTLLTGVSAHVVADTPTAVVNTTSPHARLFSLFAASDEGSLKRNPVQALLRGDMRYADQFGDFITDGYYAREKAAAEGDLSTLKTIARDQLGDNDKISYDVFK